nr:leucine-rich repeat-containing protein 74B-like [Macaca fascicularis]
MNGSCERSGEDEEQEEEATAACGRLAGVPQAKQGPEADSNADLETQDVELSENQLGVAGAQALCATRTVNQAIWKIQMSGNGLEEQAAQYLAEILLAHTDLKSLDLSYNQLNEQAGNACPGHHGP